MLVISVVEKYFRLNFRLRLKYLIPLKKINLLYIIYLTCTEGVTEGSPGHNILTPYRGLLKETRGPSWIVTRVESFCEKCDSSRVRVTFESSP